MIKDRTVGSLPQLLREYTDYGALAVNWQVLLAISQSHVWSFPLYPLSASAHASREQRVQALMSCCDRMTSLVCRLLKCL